LGITYTLSLKARHEVRLTGTTIVLCLFGMDIPFFASGSSLLTCADQIETMISVFCIICLD
jgi:hypothetical protein